MFLHRFGLYTYKYGVIFEERSKFKKKIIIMKDNTLQIIRYYRRIIITVT